MTSSEAPGRSEKSLLRTDEGMKKEKESLCPLCSEPGALIWHKEKFSLFQFPMAPPFPKVSTMNLTLYYCPSCVHGYLDPIPAAEITADFYRHHYDHYTSPLESNLTTGIMCLPIERMREKISRHFGRKVSMVNVGGSDGYSLAQLKDLCSTQFLIEPGHFAAEIARKHGIPTAEKFLDTDLAEELAEKFDVVVSTHVIEHVDDPMLFAKHMLKMLAPGGLLFIETPDLTLVLSNTLVRVITLQHLHYFSPQSLQKLIEHDAVIEHVDSIENYAFLACIQKTGAQVDLSLDSEYWRALAMSFDERLAKHCEHLKKQVESWKGKKIWLWGAGSAAGEIYHVYNLSPALFAGYIDSDLRKSSKRFISSPGLPIVTPEEARKMGVDAVVITSYSVNEITQRIEELGWNIPVADIYRRKTG